MHACRLLAAAADERAATSKSEVGADAGKLEAAIYAVLGCDLTRLLRMPAVATWEDAVWACARVAKHAAVERHQRACMAQHAKRVSGVPFASVNVMPDAGVGAVDSAAELAEQEVG
jgi:hypothetical protein